MFLLYKAECHFSSVVFRHSFHFPIDITTFLSSFKKNKTKQNIPFWSFFQKKKKKISKAAPYTWRSSHRDVMSHQKENEWQKRETHAHTLGTKQVHFTEAVLGVGRERLRFFPFIFIVPAIVSNCHLVLSGNTAKRDTEKSKQSLIIRLAWWPWKALSPPCNPVARTADSVLSFPAWLALFAKWPKSQLP